MAENSKRTKAENKKNLFYALWIVALVALMATAIVLISNFAGGNSPTVDTGGTTVDGGSSTPDENPDENPNDNPGPDDTPGDTSGGENGDDVPSGGEGSGDDTPVDGKIIFIMPCTGATVITDYTEDTLVFNSTLGAYMGHLAIDFGAEAGTDVVCVYDGVVESITTSYLTGTTVTVDHGNNLKTVYNSIEVNEALREGASISQGDLIGTVSSNNLQEHKDGPHLHFEVISGGKKVDPSQYLIGEEK